MRSFAKRLTRHARNRLDRVTAVFNFVVDLGSRSGAIAPAGRRGWNVLDQLTGGKDGPAILLSAFLQSLGERARVERTRELSFVCVDLEVGDLPRVPPHAGLLIRGRRFLLPLDPRTARYSLGFLPRQVKEVLRLRDGATRLSR